MPRKKKTSLTVLPNVNTGSTRVPRPRVKLVAAAPYSQRAMKAQIPLDVPGVKTR